jgi:phage shock protein PspC (stress-responsive transcriptional regulator)
MQKVISINLNGHAYQLEESGYDALREYLATAARDLEGNPDLTEIMGDLEQAIAEKCQRFLGPHKSVVTSAEVHQIVAEMGPIDAAPGESTKTSAGTGAGHAAGAGAARKRLFRIPEGAMVAGVCQGLAAYTGIDVGVIRLAFALLGFFSGIGIVAYIVLMFVVPEASTPEERSAAGFAPFNAQDVVDRAKKQYAEGTRRMRRHWRQHQRQWRRYGAAPAAGTMYTAPRFAPVLLPVFSLVNLALFLVMTVVLISLVNTGEVLGRELPEDVPLWAAALTVVVAYQVLASPIRAAARWAQTAPGQYAFWNTVIGLAGLAFAFWVASQHTPEIREFLQKMPGLFRDFTDAIRDLVNSR